MALGTERDKSRGAGGGGARQHGRRARGFERPVATVHAHLREVAARHGFAEPEVLLRWAEIVGERLAGLCAPVKVSYSRAREIGATLIVRAAGARAVEVEHLAPRILERVNQFYGYRAVHRLKITQTTGAPGFGEPPAAAYRFGGGPGDAEPRTPGPEAEARAAELTRGIRTPELRAALTRMAAQVLSRDAAPASPSRRTDPDN